MRKLRNLSVMDEPLRYGVAGRQNCGNNKSRQTAVARRRPDYITYVDLCRSLRFSICLETAVML
ncbi:hypothetical protein RRG08_058509 [Elysia crispata]|uniref:Uncharacterized protein n=1 Tax=Elysia crispata TaxID=231223 RepID=A0AAE1DN70_9GAST|nr:hypothetical protein RRG08_058509 [Elysia crispata]